MGPQPREQGSPRGACGLAFLATESPPGLGEGEGRVGKYFPPNLILFGKGDTWEREKLKVPVHPPPTPRLSPHPPLPSPPRAWSILNARLKPERLGLNFATALKANKHLGAASDPLPASCAAGERAACPGPCLQGDPASLRGAWEGARRRAVVLAIGRATGVGSTSN